MLEPMPSRNRALFLASALALSSCSPALRQYVHEDSWDATEKQPRIVVDECRKYEPELEWGEGTVGRTYGIVASEILAEDPSVCEIKRRPKTGSDAGGEIVTLRGTRPGECVVHFRYPHPVTKRPIDQVIELHVSPEPTPPLSDPVYEQFDRCAPDWPWKYRRQSPGSR